MTLAFLDEVNQLISEATWDVPDVEISNDADVTSSQFRQQLAGVNAVIDQFIKNCREARLQRMRLSFAQAKKEKTLKKSTYSATKSVESMLADIVNVMNRNHNVPNGLLIGFREQSKSGSEDGIRKIWEDLVDLGLISLGEDES